MAQDPDLRPPLTREVDYPCPPAQPETYAADPRIATTQANLEMSEHIIPGFLKYHPMGALVGQACMRIFASEFTSMIFSVQYRLPDYYKWLLHEADHAPAYRFHRIFLQHLQSGVPGQWLLKSPAHLWQLDTLLAECAAQSYEEVVVGLERQQLMRDKLPQHQITDVLFADFIRDPFATIHTIYARLGRELCPETEARMRTFLDSHPGDGGGSRASKRVTRSGGQSGTSRRHRQVRQYGACADHSINRTVTGRARAFQCPDAGTAVVEPAPSSHWMAPAERFSALRLAGPSGTTRPNRFSRQARPSRPF